MDEVGHACTSNTWAGLRSVLQEILIRLLLSLLP